MRFLLARTRLKFRTMTKRKLPANEDGEMNIGHCPATIPGVPAWPKEGDQASAEWI